MKDNFSTQSDQYAKYRPGYPPALFEYINTLIPEKDCAWDCGTGNGQIAVELAKTYKKVFATDISRSQIDNAKQADNIAYSVQPAEKTGFNDRQFDLIIVAQAIHWFDFEQFYSEVKRTAKENALICVTGYGSIEISGAIDKIVVDFYQNVLDGYWDKERSYIDEHYQTIPFPFEKIPAPEFVHKLKWSLEQLTGYLNTWSAVKHFIRQNGYNPTDRLQNDLAEQWGNEAEQEVRFPLLLRIGRVR